MLFVVFFVSIRENLWQKNMSHEITRINTKKYCLRQVLV